MFKKEAYCNCGSSNGCYSETDSRGSYLRCKDCEQMIEDSYENFSSQVFDESDFMYC